MSQTSVPTNQSSAFAGMLADISDADVRTFVSEEASAEMPMGAMVAQGAGSDGAVLMASAASVPVGVVLHSHQYSKGTYGELGSTGLKPKTCLNILNKGKAWVTVENAVSVNAPAYVRHTANGAGKLQPGAFRADADGVAQVSTYTPTAAEHSKGFGIRVSFSDRSYFFSVISDATMTATEVCDAFRTAMAADTEFTARVVASGSATLILTGQVAGEAFAVANAGQGAGTWAATTPPAPTCLKMKGARFLTATTGAGLALVEVDMNLDKLNRSAAGF